VFEGHGIVVPALRAALGTPPAALWLPVGNGTTTIAIHREMRALGWPSVINGVCSAGNNPVVTSWPGEYRMLPPDGVTTSDHNQPLVNWHALQGAEAMSAIADTGGEVFGVDDEQLVAARAALAPYGANPTAAGAVALAGLLACARETGSLTGTQVVLLSGR
jgi:threonine synthase